MKITLSQTEIEEAVVSYMQNIITVKDGMKMTCDFTAGRGPAGISAEINIVECAIPVKEVLGPVTGSEEPEPEEEIFNPEVAEPAQSSGSVRSLFGNL